MHPMLVEHWTLGTVQCTVQYTLHGSSWSGSVRSLDQLSKDYYTKYTCMMDEYEKDLFLSGERHRHLVYVMYCIAYIGGVKYRSPCLVQKTGVIFMMFFDKIFLLVEALFLR